LSTMESNSLLKTMLQGYAAAKTAHNDDAIAYLEAAPKGASYIALPMVNYYLGCARLNRLDEDTPSALIAYVNGFKGANYIKDAYLKLAYFYLLQNDSEKYAYYLNMVRTRGYTIDQKDKQALREANDVRPDINLLKARLYFDGGYYTKALTELNNKDVNQLKLLRDKTELYYRYGRVYDKIGKTSDALENYQQAINLGKGTSYYFSANAAVFCGRVYEERKDYNNAAVFYNEALAMKNHEYQDDIDNDAKAGLKRINR
jgi:tetratricopeptide (TPR) repeat protein